MPFSIKTVTASGSSRLCQFRLTGESPGIFIPRVAHSKPTLPESVHSCNRLPACSVTPLFDRLFCPFFLSPVFSLSDQYQAATAGRGAGLVDGLYMSFASPVSFVCLFVDCWTVDHSFLPPSSIHSFPYRSFIPLLEHSPSR
jgi:hypothetical protein